MKHAFGIIVGLLCLGILLSAANADEETKTVNEKNGPVQYEFEVLRRNESIKHGTYTERVDGQTIVSGQYDLGKMTGTWTYFRDSEKKLEEVYVNGLLNGNSIVYDDGEIIGTYSCKDGKFDGEYSTKWPENLRPHISANYTSGLLNGDYEERSADGNTVVKTVFEAGEWNGPYEAFYDNGKPRCRLHFANGELAGELAVFYDNGNPMLKGNVEDGKLVSCDFLGKAPKSGIAASGIKDGEGSIYVYNNTDSVVYFLHFSNGVLHGKQVIHEDGRITKEIEFMNGKPHGSVKHYDEKGRINYSGQCENGYKVGAWTTGRGRKAEVSDPYSVADKDTFKSFHKYGLGTFLMDIKPTLKKMYEVVDDQPMFSGGEMALGEFLRDHIQYPSMEKNNGIEGTTYIHFTVSHTGELDHIRVYPGSESRSTTSMREESLRVISMMPRWQPGLKDGIPVDCKFMLPIKYTLRR